MNIRIQDGAYRARMTGAQVKLSSKGTPYLTFLWKTEQDFELKSFFFLTDKTGGPNEKGKALVRKWCPKWDGSEYWFNEHFDEVSQIPVTLVVKNEPSFKDPSLIYPTVKWVNPANSYSRQSCSADRLVGCSDGSSPNCQSDTQVGFDIEASVPTPESRTEFESYLDQLSPTMADAWTAINVLYRGKSAAFIEKAWFSIIDTYANGKDQDQFSEAQWQSVINHMREM